MLCENCEKVILKSIQRKYYKTVMNIEMGEEAKLNFLKEEKQIPVKVQADLNFNTYKEKDEKSKEKNLIIFD